jgi:peptidoglycan/xylan/chitin deacetylase (PgdA/CDA1 family)
MTVAPTGPLSAEEAVPVSNPRIPFELSSRRRRLPPPDGKPLIVQIVVNIEHWPYDRPMPRQVLTPTAGVSPMPDVPNWSWAEYGMRCGMPRLIELFGRLGLPVAAAINASVIDMYPSLAAAIRDAGWELMGHCWIQRTLQNEVDEAAVIGACVERLSDFTGRRTRGWLGAGLHETVHTPEHLKASGLDYVSDWVLDDLPCWLPTARGPLIAMPYTLELNDAVIYAIEKQSSDEIARRIGDTVAVLERELAGNPRVLTIALHPYAIAVPHRLIHLEYALEKLKARDDTIFMTGAAIADWFQAADGKAAPAGHPEDARGSHAAGCTR